MFKIKYYITYVVSNVDNNTAHYLLLLLTLPTSKPRTKPLAVHGNYKHGYPCVNNKDDIMNNSLKLKEGDAGPIEEIKKRGKTNSNQPN